MLIFSGLLLINTILSKNFSFTLMNKKAIILFLLFFFYLLFNILYCKEVICFVKKHFLENEKRIFYFSHGMLIVGVLFNFFYLFLQPGTMGVFDAGMIFEFIYNSHDRSGYFSQNPNNLLIYWLEMGIKLIVPFLSKYQFMTLLQIMNVVVIALSLFIFYLAIKKFSSSKSSFNFL